MMLLAAITVPWWGWLIIGAGGMLLFGGGGPIPEVNSIHTLKLPYDPPQKLAPTTEALDHLHRVADHLEAKGLAAESITHVDALAALLNRRQG